MLKKGIVGGLILSVLLLEPFVSWGQVAPAVNPSYARGKVILKDGTRYEAVNINFAVETLTFTDKKTGQPFTFPLPEVDFVSRTKSYALEGALAGGGLMLSASLAAVLQAAADPYLETKPNAGLIILGLTAGGVGIGALIGSALSSEKTVFQKGRLVVRLSVPLTLQALPCGAGLSFAGLRIQF